MGPSIVIQLPEKDKFIELSSGEIGPLIVLLCRKLANEAYYSLTWEDIFLSELEIIRTPAVR